MKKTTLLLFVLAVSLFTLAHEFWLRPAKFFYTIRETANLRFLVGEHFTGENWKGNRDKVTLLAHFTPDDKSTDISARLSSNIGDSLQLPLKDEGTHMVIFNSTNNFIQLEAAKFNDYLKDDGLEQVLLYRKQKGEEQKDGTEFYQRSVKTIVQVGGRVTDACTSPTPLPLDIIPSQNPYSVPDAEPGKNPVFLKFRVLFRGKPLENALVRAWYRQNGGNIGIDSLRTDKRGWISAERHSGPYMVSCVHMVPNQTGGEAQWQSYWGSLSFEYSQFFSNTSSR